MSEIEYSVLTEKLNGMTTLLNAQFINVNEKLDGVNNHLAKLNGKIAEHEKRFADMESEELLEKQKFNTYIESRDTGCPQLPRIIELETKNRIGISKSQLIIGIISIMVAISSIAYSSIKINESLRVKDMKTIVQSQNKVITNQDTIKLNTK